MIKFSLRFKTGVNHSKSFKTNQNTALGVWRDRTLLDCERAPAAYFFDSGKNNKEMIESRGTLWAAYNGVAE